MAPKPHIVFVINYFYPDVASIAQLFTELCLHLQKDFRITVIAAQPAYAGEQVESKARVETSFLEEIEIVRIRMPQVNKRSKLSRIRYIATYFLQALWQLLRQKDVQFIYTVSQPPILGGLIGTLGKLMKRAKHIYNIQDFNPEQAEAAGFLRNKWLLRLARWVDMRNCRHADHIITVGHDMQETLLKRFAHQSVTGNSVINNWTNEQEIVPLPAEYPQVAAFRRKHGLEGRFVVMYSGNLGLFYDLENLIRITDEFKGQADLSFVFIGEGAVKKEMQEHVTRQGIENVMFLPYQPIEELVYSLNAADVHLVVNQKGIKGVSVPSKIYGVMAAGKPILGVLEHGSEAQKLIRESGCGVVVEPQRYGEITAAIRSLQGMDRTELGVMGLSGRRYLERHLTKEMSLERYRKLLLSLSVQGGKTV